MSKLFSVLTGLIMLSASSAHAVGYDYYAIRCHVLGTQETSFESATKLPRELRLEVAFVTAEAKAGTVTSTASLFSMSQDAEQFSLELNAVGETTWHPLCDGHEMSARLGELDAAQLKDVLTALGATSVPSLDLAPHSGNVSLGVVRLGTACQTFGGDDTDERVELNIPFPAFKIGFPNDFQEGLAYRVSFSDCRVHYVEARRGRHR